MKTLEVAWLIATDECPFNTEKGQAVAMLKAVLHVEPLLSENHWIRIISHAPTLLGSCCKLKTASSCTSIGVRQTCPGPTTGQVLSCAPETQEGLGYRPRPQGM